MQKISGTEQLQAREALTQLQTIEDRLIVGMDAPMVEQSTGPKDMGVRAFAFCIKENGSASHGQKENGNS